MLKFPFSFTVDFCILSHCCEHTFTTRRICMTVYVTFIGSQAFRHCTKTYLESHAADSDFYHKGIAHFSSTFCSNFCTRASTTFFNGDFACCDVRCRGGGAGMTASGSNGFRTFGNDARTWATWTLHHSCFANDDANFSTSATGMARG